jgi:nitrate reductase gamma subunit
MSSIELLNWARGPGLQWSLAIFIAGMILRTLEIFLLGRKPDLAEARGGSIGPGLRTVVTRSVPAKGLWLHSIAGYVFHVGFFVTLVFFTPHILLLAGVVDYRWPALPNSIIDVATIASIAALAFALVTRITDPVRRYLSRFSDYLALILTLLPLLTGYLAFHRLGLDYTLMLALHILSVELLLVLAPFTKLTHTITLLFARWYNGAIAGRKGVNA